jgi:hypothetical protein
MHTNYYFVLLVLVSVPLLILTFSRNSTVKENRRYAELRKSLERKQLEKIWKAFELTGIVPLPEGFNEKLKIPMFYDKCASKVYAFEVEELLEGSKKIPKSYQELIQQFRTSNLVNQGWRTCDLSEGQEFLDRLAQLDDELDFEITSGDASISNKIAFDLIFITVNSSDGSIERTYKLNDGDVESLSVKDELYGTLNAVIDVKDFKRSYSSEDFVEVASKRVEFI